MSTTTACLLDARAGLLLQGWVLVADGVLADLLHVDVEPDPAPLPAWIDPVDQVDPTAASGDWNQIGSATGTLPVIRRQTPTEEVTRC